MRQVHTGAYVSLLAPGETDYTACHPRKTTTYILHVVSTYHYAYARQAQVNWKKETKKTKEDKGKERKDKEAKKRKRKRKKRKDKTIKQGKEKRKK